MRCWTIFAAATLLALAATAKAQVLVYGVPINLAGNLSANVVTDGNTLKMDSSVTAILHNIQGTLTATLPQVNKTTKCRGSPRSTDIEVIFSRLSIDSADVFNPTTGIRVTGDISARYCKANLSLGQATFSVPLSVELKIHSSSSPTIMISTGSVQLTPAPGVSVVNVVFAVGGKQFVEEQVNNLVTKKVKDINKSLRDFTTTLANQQLFRTFSPSIELTRVGLDGDDLSLNLHLTGQVAGDAVSAWLENRNAKMTVLKSRGRKTTRARPEAGV